MGPIAEDAIPIRYAYNRAQVRARLIEAVNKRDTRTVESLVAFPLRAEKVRFASETCRKFWGVSVLVRTSNLSAFVDCLASQKVTALTSAADINVDAIFGPGFPLGIAFNADNKVVAQTSSSAPGSKPLRIEPSTFASHVTGFTREIAPSKDTRQALDTRGAKVVQAELSLCVEADGATVPVATVADPALRSYEQDVTAVARSWGIKPFLLDGKAVLACATYVVGSSAAALDASGPLTIEPRRVDSEVLGSLRIRGSEHIVPDDVTKAKIWTPGPGLTLRLPQPSTGCPRFVRGHCPLRVRAPRLGTFRHISSTPVRKAEKAGRLKPAAWGHFVTFHQPRCGRLCGRLHRI